MDTTTIHLDLPAKSVPLYEGWKAVIDGDGHITTGIFG